MLEDGAADGGLAGPHLAGQLDETLGLADAEKDVVERLAVPIAEEQEARIGRDVERRLLEAVEGIVHGAAYIASGECPSGRARGPSFLPLRPQGTCPHPTTRAAPLPSRRPEPPSPSPRAAPAGCRRRRATW